MSTRFSGVVLGVVTTRDDPDHEGRIQVRFPWLDSGVRSAWASIAAPMAGGGRGFYFMPEEGDEVLLAFQHDDFDHPFVVGFMWNGVHEPPSGDVRQRIIRSVNGHSIRFVDSTPAAGSSGALIVEDAHGNTVTLSNAKISVRSQALLELYAPQVVIAGPGYRRIIAPNNNVI
jgi:uncharacterized protein involved in type VI secretion and phage assembly